MPFRLSDECLGEVKAGPRGEGSVFHVSESVWSELGDFWGVRGFMCGLRGIWEFDLLISH